MAANDERRRVLVGKYGAALRWRGPDDPQTAEALAAVQETARAVELDVHIERLVAMAPLLTAGQRSRLANLLRPAGDGGEPGGSTAGVSAVSSNL